LLRESDSYAPEELVNDLYLRLRVLKSPNFWGISSFYSYSVRVMSHILIDHARARLAEKRGGGALKIDFSEIDEGETPSEEIEVDTRLTLQYLLEGLKAKSPTVRRIASLRLELGYTTKEIADELNLDRGVVARQWGIAKNHIIGTLNAAKKSSPLESDIIIQDYSPRIIKPVVSLDLVSPELIRALTKHPELMKTLDWRAFEYLLSTILEKLEYEVELQRGTKDGGIDIFAIKRGGPLGPHRYLLQAKRWSSAVDVKPVRELLFLRDQHRVTKACLATTSRFTRGAWRLGDEYQWVLELRDYFGLQEWVKLCEVR
jgi:RNA polymerase sigma factor (sigma-70 family)